MRIIKQLSLGAAVIALAAGCTGPEQKLGRGINNVTEFVRLGEIRRSIEQEALWSTPEKAYTTGFIHGFNRSVARTIVGAFEIATFPIPSYEPIMKPADVVYPDNYRPALLADSLFSTDTALGFNGGDVLPVVPGSRFHVFDY
jgi:putative exosortase-associated protein (TIGR04073 family)